MYSILDVEFVTDISYSILSRDIAIYLVFPLSKWLQALFNGRSSYESLFQASQLSYSPHRTRSGHSDKGNHQTDVSVKGTKVIRLNVSHPPKSQTLAAGEVTSRVVHKTMEMQKSEHEKEWNASINLHEIFNKNYCNPTLAKHCDHCHGNKMAAALAPPSTVQAVVQ